MSPTTPVQGPHEPEENPFWPRFWGQNGKEATGGMSGTGPALASPAMSKKTNKRKNKARSSKANHGTKPNAGR